MEDYNQINDELDKAANEFNKNVSRTDQIKNISNKILTTASCSQCYLANMDILKGLIDLVEMSEYEKEMYKLAMSGQANIMLGNLNILEDTTNYPHINIKELCLRLTFIAIISLMPGAELLPADMSSDIIDVCVHEDDTNN